MKVSHWVCAIFHSALIEYLIIYDSVWDMLWGQDADFWYLWYGSQLKITSSSCKKNLAEFISVIVALHPDKCHALLTMQLNCCFSVSSSQLNVTRELVSNEPSKHSVSCENRLHITFVVGNHPYHVLQYKFTYPMSYTRALRHCGSWHTYCHSNLFTFKCVNTM